MLAVYGSLAFFCWLIGAFSGWWMRNTHLWFHRMKHHLHAMLGFMKMAAIMLIILVIIVFATIRYQGWL